MAEPIHKPIRFPGRPRGKPNKRCRVAIPQLDGTEVEYRTEVVREANSRCVRLLQCVAGVCKTLFTTCEGENQ